MTDQRNLPPGHRGLRLAGAPTHSVVVASARDRGALDRFLGELLPVCQARSIEVVVARNCDVTEYRELERAYPKVLFMPGPVNATLRQLRASGLSAADGDIVSLIDDSKAIDPAWLAELASSEEGESRGNG